MTTPTARAVFTGGQGMVGGDALSAGRIANERGIGGGGLGERND